jgi:hypothetical protein
MFILKQSGVTIEHRFALLKRLTIKSFVQNAGLARLIMPVLSFLTGNNTMSAGTCSNVSYDAIARTVLLPLLVGFEWVATV